jgi:hypothetical protein
LKEERWFINRKTGGYEEAMEEPFNSKERRRHLRSVIDLPLEYRDIHDPRLRGAIVVNASEGGFLIETVRDMPVGEELNITVLYAKGFELANFKVTAKIVWKEPYWKDDPYRNGYQYGSELIQISDEDRWKLNYLLGNLFESEKTPTSLSSQL